MNAVVSSPRLRIASAKNLAHDLEEGGVRLRLCRRTGDDELVLAAQIDGAGNLEIMSDDALVLRVGENESWESAARSIILDVLPIARPFVSSARRKGSFSSSVEKIEEEKTEVEEKEKEKDTQSIRKNRPEPSSDDALVFVSSAVQSREIRVLLPDKLIAEFGNYKVSAFHLGHRKVLWMWNSASCRRGGKITRDPSDSENYLRLNDKNSNESPAPPPLHVGNDALPIIFDLESNEDSMMSKEDLHDAMICRWGFSDAETKEVLKGLEETTLLDEQQVITVRSRLQELALFGPGLLTDLDETTREILLSLFVDSPRILIERISGGFSGADVFRCTAHTISGLPELPVIVKVARFDEVQNEIGRMSRFAPLLGENAPQLLENVTQGDKGGIKIELCGATWCLPEIEPESIFIGTFKEMFVAELEQVGAAGVGDACGPTAAVHTNTVSDSPFLNRKRRKSSANSLGGLVQDSNQVFGEVVTVLGEVFGSILFTPSCEMAFVQEKSLFSEGGFPLVEQISRAVALEITGPSDECLWREPCLLELMRKWSGEKTSDDYENDLRCFFKHIASKIDDHSNNEKVLHTRRMGHVHGDLNGSNILIDSESIVWLIDFASSGEGPILQDLTKLETSILLEYTPISSACPRFLAEFEKIVVALAEMDVKRQLPPLSSIDIDLSVPGLSVLEHTWSAIARIRQHAALYSALEPDSLQLHAGRFYYSLKCLSYVDLTIVQKRFALLASVGHAQRLLSVLHSKETRKSSLSNNTRFGSKFGSGSVPRSLTSEITRADAEYKAMVQQMLARERVKYMTTVAAKESSFIDPASRSKISVLRQSVNLSLDPVSDVLIGADTSVFSLENCAHAKVALCNVTSSLIEYAMQIADRKLSNATSLDEPFLQSLTLDVSQALEFNAKCDEYRKAIAALKLRSDEHFVVNCLFKVDFGARNNFSIVEDLANVWTERLISYNEQLRSIATSEAEKSRLKDLASPAELEELKILALSIKVAGSTGRAVASNVRASNRRKSSSTFHSRTDASFFINSASQSKAANHSGAPPMERMESTSSRLERFDSGEFAINSSLEERFMDSFAHHTEPLSPTAQGGKREPSLSAAQESLCESSSRKTHCQKPGLASYLSSGAPEYLEKVRGLLPELDLAVHTRILIVGAAATGKSVLLRKILLYAVLEQDYKHNNACWTPLRIQLIDMRRLISRYNLSSESDLLGIYLDDKFGVNSGKTHFLKRSLSAGRVILLLDGLDEAGSKGLIIMQWVRRLFAEQFDQRVIITSRDSSLMDADMSLLCSKAKFQIAKIQPLTPNMVAQVVRRRIKGGLHRKAGKKQVAAATAKIKYIQSQLALPEYAVLASNPLSLSLLIHVLGRRFDPRRHSFTSVKRQSEHGEGGKGIGNTTRDRPLSLEVHDGQQQLQHMKILTKSNLLSLAIQQMLHRGDSLKYRRRNLTNELQQLEQDFDRLGDKLTMHLLRDLALMVHQRKRRDISVELFAEAVIAPPRTRCFRTRQATTSASHNYTLKVEIHNALQRCIQLGHISLFQVRDTRPGRRSGGIMEAGEQSTGACKSGTKDDVAAHYKTGSGALDRVIMFSHLSLQEHLAAECIAGILRDAETVLPDAGEHADSSEGDLAKADRGLTFLNRCSCLIRACFEGERLEQAWWHEVFLTVCTLLAEQLAFRQLDELFKCLFDPSDVTRRYCMPVSRKALESIWVTMCSSGNVAVFDRIFRLRKSINARFCSCLQEQCTSDNLSNEQDFELLLIKDSHANACLHLTAEHNRVELLRTIMARLADPELIDLKKQLLASVNDVSWNPSSLSLCHNNLECYRILTQTDGDRDIENEDEATQGEMLRLVKESNVWGLRKALEADPREGFAHGSTGITVSMWAAILGNVEMLAILVEADVREHYKTAKSKSRVSLLWYAVEHNSVECVEYLLSKGMSAKEEDRNHESLLLVATSFGFNAIARLLIRAGADAAEALVISAIQGRNEFVRQLIAMSEGGYDLVNQIVTIGVHPLAAACVAGHQRTVALLLRCGASVNLPINVPYGSCALHLAAQNGFIECIELLLKNGADINQAVPPGSLAPEGQTVLQIAVDNDDANLAQYLREKGALLWEDITREQKQAAICDGSNEEDA